jgi:hypothetical protein
MKIEFDQIRQSNLVFEIRNFEIQIEFDWIRPSLITSPFRSIWPELSLSQRDAQKALHWACIPYSFMRPLPCIIKFEMSNFVLKCIVKLNKSLIIIISYKQLLKLIHTFDCDVHFTVRIFKTIFGEMLFSEILVFSSLFFKFSSLLEGRGSPLRFNSKIFKIILKINQKRYFLHQTS